MRITQVSKADADRLVELLCQEYDAVRDRLTTEASWEQLRQFFLGKLRLFGATPSPDTEWPVTLVTWARAGHPAADRALRDYASEMGQQSRFEEMLVSVRAYYLETSGKAFVPFPRGRPVVANLMRNIWIPAVLDHVAAATGLPAVRSNTSPHPAVSYFLALVMKRRKVKLKETEIRSVYYWARKKLPAALEAWTLEHYKKPNSSIIPAD
jgi:hypothetical protein